MPSELYYERKRRGICVQCARRKARKDKVLCGKCNDKQVKYWKQKRKKMRKKGLCVRCGSVVKEKGFGRCKKCRSKRIVHDRDRYKRLLKSNICTNCGKNKSQKYRTLCEDCWFKHMTSRVLGGVSHWHRIKAKFYRQNGSCVYSGIKLIPGKNASIDHIIPKSRGGTNKLSNLQWVDRDVNMMKSNMRQNRFLKLVHLIYKHQMS